MNRDLVLKGLIVFGVALKVRPLWAKGYLGALLLGTLWFFREPGTPISKEPGITSPSYGKITDIVSDSSGHHVSIFLNVFDPHAQYAPLKSVITDRDYRHGTFHPAQLYAKTRFNERCMTGFTTASGETIYVTQIAGWIARRILSFEPVGSSVKRGQPFGMIRFGSRVDISFPLTYHLRVKVGDIMQGPGTVLASK